MSYAHNPFGNIYSISHDFICTAIRVDNKHMLLFWMCVQLCIWVCQHCLSLSMCRLCHNSPRQSHMSSTVSMKKSLIYRICLNDQACSRNLKTYMNKLYIPTLNYAMYFWLHTMCHVKNAITLRRAGSGSSLLRLQLTLVMQQLWGEHSNFTTRHYGTVSADF